MSTSLENWYVDVEDLKAKADEYSKDLAGIMITYPSTYGVYEETVKEITEIIHQHGGQVYMDENIWITIRYCNCFQILYDKMFY